MRATFRDVDTEEALDREGFVTVELLDEDEVQHLRRSYEALGAAPGDPSIACHSSFHSYDRGYKVRVDSAIRNTVWPHLDRLLDRQRALPCNFIVKWPAATSGFGLHQDLSLVDERQHRSVEVWIALDDTNAQNGQLWMCPKSHKWLPGHIRGINGFEFPFGGVSRRIISRHAVPVPVRAGQAIIFNHATLHFSFPNKSQTHRTIAITDLIPEEAQHLHYFGNDQGRIDVYEIGEDFWTDNTPFTLWEPPPSSSLVTTIDRMPRPFGDEDLDRLVASGQAIESDLDQRGAINAANGWCHRCGSKEVGGYPPDRWVGNVTLLCEQCRSIEITRAASVDHVAPLAQ